MGLRQQPNRGGLQVPLLCSSPSLCAPKGVRGQSQAARPVLGVVLDLPSWGWGGGQRAGQWPEPTLKRPESRVRVHSSLWGRGNSRQRALVGLAPPMGDKKQKARVGLVCPIDSRQRARVGKAHPRGTASRGVSCVWPTRRAKSKRHAWVWPARWTAGRGHG